MRLFRHSASFCVLGLLWLGCFGGRATVQAQPTNLAHFQAMAVACLGDVPTASAFVLEAPTLMPYLRSALVAQWQADGRTVFVPDSARTALPQLAYQVESVAVTYARDGRKRYTRTVSLALRYTWVNAAGQLVQDQRCPQSVADTLLRREKASVENPAYPETQGETPPSGWLRRYLEPAAITAATAVGVYLFFSLRSDRADGG